MVQILKVEISQLVIVSINMSKMIWYKNWNYHKKFPNSQHQYWMRKNLLEKGAKVFLSIQRKWISAAGLCFVIIYTEKFPSRTGSRYYVHFRTDKLEKGMNHHISTTMG